MKNEPIISIQACYDPEAEEGEYREYNYCARVVVSGTWREAYFYSLSDALSWAYDKAIALASKANLAL